MTYSLSLPRHRSVVALLEAEGNEDPVTVIRRRARTLVAEAREIQWMGPPFDLSELASLRGLKVAVTTDLADDQDACVMPGQILLNFRKHRVRQRFSLAHEIAHTLFPDYEDEVARAGRLWRRTNEDSEFERLCQIAAAEFLFPLDTFLSRIEGFGVCISGVLEIAVEFDASIEATARRAVETAIQPVVGVIFRPRDPATGEWVEMRQGDAYLPFASLGASFIWQSDACHWSPIAKGTIPPKGSAADRAWKRVPVSGRSLRIEVTRRDSWAVGGKVGLWDSEAMTLPKKAIAPHEVLCLMRRSVA